MKKAADVSKCGKYRYSLTRSWGEGAHAIFIMLNPSLANAAIDDRTIKKCTTLCVGWGLAGFHVVNLFAFITPHVEKMKRAADPYGPRQEKAFHRIMQAHLAQDNPGPVVCAWGVDGAWQDQDLRVMRWLALYPTVEPRCLSVTKDGHPKHPLYQKGTTQHIPYTSRHL